jgi:hypothetical protein
VGNLLTVGNPKTAKGEGFGYLTAILHLAPADTAGVGNVCPWATEGCKRACLNTAGRGGIFRKGETTNAIQEARARKTREFMRHRSEFVAQLVREIRAHVKRAAAHGLKPAIRLNGTSDLPWERIAPDLFRHFSDVQFYDYTKSTRRALDSRELEGHPRNYHLTVSRSESSDPAQLRAILAAGGNVAVVFARSMTPKERDAWAFEAFGVSTIDGDASDLRFTDPHGVVVALTEKGRARKDSTGFVVRG